MFVKSKAINNHNKILPDKAIDSCRSVRLATPISLKLRVSRHSLLWNAALAASLSDLGVLAPGAGIVPEELRKGK
jgi:hypothetical protein